MNKRAYDDDDLEVSALRHGNSISKDWVIGILVAMVSGLIGLGLVNLNNQQKTTLDVVAGHSNDIERLKANSSDITRRLDRIDNKIDILIDTKRNT